MVTRGELIRTARGDQRECVQGGRSHSSHAAASSRSRISAQAVTTLRSAPLPDLIQRRTDLVETPSSSAICSMVKNFEMSVVLRVPVRAQSPDAGETESEGKEIGCSRMLTSYALTSRGGGRHADRLHMPRNGSQPVSNSSGKSELYLILIAPLFLL